MIIAILGAVVFAIAVRVAYLCGFEDGGEMWRRACQAQTQQIRELEQQLSTERIARYRRERMRVVRETHG